MAEIKTKEPRLGPKRNAWTKSCPGMTSGTEIMHEA
jgi:hypothetical protein